MGNQPCSTRSSVSESTAQPPFSATRTRNRTWALCRQQFRMLADSEQAPYRVPGGPNSPYLLHAAVHGLPDRAAGEVVVTMCRGFRSERRVRGQVVILPHAPEGDGAEGVDGDRPHDERLDRPAQPLRGQGKEHDQARHVVEGEAIAELDPA